MKAIGIVFLYDRALGTPELVSKDFSAQFSNVSENLVLEGLLELPDLKFILDNKNIFWGGIKENFQEIQENENMIGRLAWRIFKDYSGIESSEEVKSLIYKANDAPWNFTLMVCVLYEQGL
ncbi:MAG: hypothetical protein EAX89_02070 [Candidatus Lokiarchaeota archaeon]|nr:hypothetical protein [Candidatus Lokiarchaeota archaeon]